MDTTLPSITILGVSITNASKRDILEFVVKRIRKGHDKTTIVTPNPEIIVAASRSEELRDILNSATVSLADGVGVVLAGSILKKPIEERITGVDFMQELCRESVRQSLTIGLLGGSKGVAEKTSKCLIEKYPGLIVNFASDTWSESVPHIDILFVAFGAPKQEKWIHENLPNIDVSCVMGVGGAFDYISGKVTRAPKVIRTMGMEWAFRLAIQPWRIRRQLALPVFAGKVLLERIGK